LRKSTQSNMRLVSANVVYEHPSVLALATFACQFALPVTHNRHQESTIKTEEMLKMAEAYSHDFPKHHPSVATPGKDVVMVTGTTGSLGSVLLAELVACKDVIRVFAVNRKDPGGATLSDRQMAALERQGLEPAIATSSKVILVEADVVRFDMGLSSDVLESVCRRVLVGTLADDYFPHRSVRLSRISFTMVRGSAPAFQILSTKLPAAWRVDFNLALQSFEPYVKGLRNLIDLALSSPHANPPRLLFTSSVGVLSRECGHLWFAMPSD
jgi:hypothetical protein